MKNNAPILLLPLFIAIISCNNSSKKNEDSETKKDSSSPATNVTTQADSSSNKKDSIAKFETDDYPVTDKMLECAAPKSNCEYRYKDLISTEKKWFTNDALNQTLVVEFYTDYFRTGFFLFSNTDIPTGLIKEMSLSNSQWEEAGEKQKLQNFKGLLSFGQKINPEYFTSAKGFKLGDTKEKVLQVYGNPEKTKTVDGVEECEWDFIGDEVYEGNADLKGKLLAKDSYGHQVILFFRNNKLIGIVLHNDIP
ncbi:MAG: hypothetical protein HZB42_05515 [Sphingobacteriales bacterium]|nr:hypothetical protein [Sphingobacteriales bacterium]